MIDNETINQIRNSVDIVDVISSYIPLTKRGKNHFGVCPFHDDVNPSMSVSSQKQMYKCFSCGAAGNVFTFVKDYENINFYESLKLVADKAGIPIDIQINKKTNKENILYPIYDVANKFYQNNLNTEKGLKAKKYLSERGIDDTIIKTFEIGLSIDLFDMLYNLLKNKDYSNEQLIKSGLVNFNNDKYNDVFFNRIMFPLHDSTGKVVGFSGRIFNKETHSKYINTKETEIFKKSEILYNYHRAKDEVRKTKQIIIVEGFMDVIALYQNNIKNTIAIMGTAFTKQHALLVKKIANEVIICLDGDEAGQKATLLCANELVNVGLTPKIMNLENNMDPDDYIKKHGKNNFLDKIDNAINIMDFKISYFKSNINLKDSLELARYVNRLLQELLSIKDDILLELTLKKISDESKLSIETLRSKLSELKNEKKSTREEVKVDVEIKNIKYDKYHLAERYLLYYMLNSEDVIKIYRRRVSYLPSYECRILAMEISMFLEKYGYFKIADLFTEFGENEKMNRILSEVASQDLKEEYTQEEIDDYISALDEYNKKVRVKNLMDKMNSSISKDEKIKLAEQIRMLKMEE